MALGLQGKSVLVLASSKGLGKAIATEFVLEGACVMLTSRDEATLAKTARELNNLASGEVSYRVCDITRSDQIQNLVAETIGEFGKIDVLVNNSGGPPAGDFDFLDDRDWQHAFELNLLSYVRTIREVLPHMRRQRGGHIINIASMSAKEPIDGLILSNTFRTAVAGFAKTLSRELASDNILVNTVGPGRIGTDRVEYLDRKRSEEMQISYEKVRSMAEEEIPLRRYGMPTELAKLVAFLGSPVNTYITGQVILIDGGLTKAI